MAMEEEVETLEGPGAVPDTIAMIEAAIATGIEAGIETDADGHHHLGVRIYIRVAATADRPEQGATRPAILLRREQGPIVRPAPGERVPTRQLGPPMVAATILCRALAATAPRPA